MTKIIAGIVTYNPSLESLKKNIIAIINQVDKIVLVDNASTNMPENWVQTIESFWEGIVVIQNSQNKGISAALNQICSFSVINEYDWVLTLDQDSLCPKELIDQLMKGIADDVAIISPNIVYKYNEKYANFDKKGIESVPWVITSASLTNLYIWRELGGFDEILFIDGVDRDYCIRAYRAGYKILKMYDIALVHELGKLKCRKIFGKTIYVTNHSKIRKYYMARNAVYLDKKLQSRDAFIYLVKMLIKTILFEDNKIEKCTSIFLGIIDGKCLKNI